MLAAFEKRADALAEIVTSVDPRNEIIAVHASAMLLQPAYGFLGYLDRQRSMLGDFHRGLERMLIRMPLRHYLVQQAKGFRLVGGEQTRTVEKFLGWACADQIDKPRVIGHRETIAHGARDRHAQFGRGAAIAEVTNQRESGAAPDRITFDCGDGGLGERFERPDRPLDPRLVSESVCGIANFVELGNIRSRSERLVSRAADDHHADFGVRLDGRTVLYDVFIHRPGERVVELRPVQRKHRERRPPLEYDFRFFHCTSTQIFSLTARMRDARTDLGAPQFACSYLASSVSGGEATPVGKRFGHLLPEGGLSRGPEAAEQLVVDCDCLFAPIERTERDALVEQRLSHLLPEGGLSRGAEAAEQLVVDCDCLFAPIERAERDALVDQHRSHLLPEGGLSRGAKAAEQLVVDCDLLFAPIERAEREALVEQRLSHLLPEGGLSRGAKAAEQLVVDCDLLFAPIERAEREALVEQRLSHLLPEGGLSRGAEAVEQLVVDRDYLFAPIERAERDALAEQRLSHLLPEGGLSRGAKAAEQLVVDCDLLFAPIERAEREALVEQRLSHLLPEGGLSRGA